MRGTAKFILSIVAAALFVFCATIVALMGTGLVPDRGPNFFWVGAGSAALVALVATVARVSRRSGPVQAMSLILPFLLFGVTTFLCFGGDAQEHLVRGFLHHVHRALPQDWVGWSITGVMLIVPLLSASLLWVALSVLCPLDVKVPLMLCAPGWGLVGIELALSSAAYLFLKKDVIVGIILAVLALAVTALVVLIVRQLRTDLRLSRALAVPAGTLLLFALAPVALLLKSSPEVRLPEVPALQTMNVANLNSVMQGAKPWTCFSLLSDVAWSWSTATPANAAPSACGETIPRRPARFKAEPSRAQGTDLWLEDGPQRRLLKRYRCSEIRLYEISADRVVVTGCTQLEVFDGQGNQVGFVDFIRPEVRFASLSEDPNRFVVIVYVIGFGDPPHLEEETVVVYNAANACLVLAAKLDPIPNSRAWGALSPEGSRLAVGADNTLRLFQLPPARNETRR